ncbi:hypothetical protein RI054_17g81170 [Pseudoscourfieldia marina]
MGVVDDDEPSTAQQEVLGGDVARFATAMCDGEPGCDFKPSRPRSGSMHRSRLMVLGILRDVIDIDERYSERLRSFRMKYWHGKKYCAALVNLLTSGITDGP